MLVFSGMMAEVKSLQQRELSGILTRFPIEPLGTAYRLQRYSFLFFKNTDYEKKLLFLHFISRYFVSRKKHTQ
jgi:hypothetical protein